MFNFLRRPPLPKIGVTAEQHEFISTELTPLLLHHRRSNDGCSWCLDWVLGPRGWADLKWDACDLHDHGYQYLRQTELSFEQRYQRRLLLDDVFYTQTYWSLCRVGWPKWAAKWYAGLRYRAVRIYGGPSAKFTGETKLEI